MGSITGLLVTYSVTLTQELRNSWERESRERQTDETDRQVADDDVTSESHKSIAQTNRTNEVAQKLLTSLPRMESQNDAWDAPEQLRCVWST